MVKRYLIYHGTIAFILLAIGHSASAQGVTKELDDLAITLTQQQGIEFKSGKGITLDNNQINEIKNLTELDIEGISTIPVDSSSGRLSGDILKISIIDLADIVASKILGITIINGKLEINLNPKRVEEINSGAGLELGNSEKSVIKKLTGFEVKDRYALLLMGRLSGNLLQIPIEKFGKDATEPRPSIREEYGGSEGY